ncbi:MAG: ammonia channel protein, partial [Gemmatimonadota bacterium]
LDDSLDVFAAHGVGGATGALLTGVFASVGAEGLLAGNAAQFVSQLISIVVVFAYSAIGTVVILKVVQAVAGLRPDADLEIRGMDVLSHGEEGYATGDGAVLILDEELNGGSAAA